MTAPVVGLYRNPISVPNNYSRIELLNCTHSAECSYIHFKCGFKTLNKFFLESALAFYLA
ncbi:hypothetical protein QTP88_011053 [Uroleucon formosanum]